MFLYNFFPFVGLCSLQFYLEWGGVYLNNIRDTNFSFLWDAQPSEPDHLWAHGHTGGCSPTELELNLGYSQSSFFHEQTLTLTLLAEKGFIGRMSDSSQSGWGGWREAQEESVGVKTEPRWHPRTVCSRYLPQIPTIVSPVTPGL